MGIDDVVNKSKQFLEQDKEKIEQALHSDKAEHVSDSVINAAAEFIKKITPDSADAKIDDAREKVDGAVGNDSASSAPGATQPATDPSGTPAAASPEKPESAGSA